MLKLCFIRGVVCPATIALIQDVRISQGLIMTYIIYQCTYITQQYNNSERENDCLVGAARARLYPKVYTLPSCSQSCIVYVYINNTIIHSVIIGFTWKYPTNYTTVFFFILTDMRLSQKMIRMYRSRKVTYVEIKSIIDSLPTS